MKNFYDATGIKPNLKLKVVLRVKPVGDVKTHLQINDANWDITLSKEEIFKHEVALTSPIEIQIQIQRQHPEAVEIELEIEGHKILPIYQDTIKCGDCYLNTNDVWKCSIPNFYSWYHNIRGQGWII